MLQEKKCLECGGVFTVERGRGKANATLCSSECRKRRRVKSTMKIYWSDPEKARRKDREYKRKHKRQLDQYRKKRRASSEGYVDRFMERAKVNTQDSDLTREFFEDKMEVCAITGVPFQFKNKYKAYHNPYAPSIDRVDSRRGYYKDNVQVVLACINRMKNDLPNEDFLKLWRALTC